MVPWVPVAVNSTLVALVTELAIVASLLIEHPEPQLVVDVTLNVTVVE